MAAFLCQVQHAVAQPACPNANTGAYKPKSAACNTCNGCKINDLASGKKYTCAIANAIFRCSTNRNCKGPAPKFGYDPQYDLNNDGVVNTKDYNIAVKCNGCTVVEPTSWK
jgi:hypothetical protein